MEQLCWGTGPLGVPDEKIGIVVGAPSKDSNEKMQQPSDQEPLALLVIHAAMHMLFLPQFTCDYYEDAPLEERKETPHDRDIKADAGLKRRKVDNGVPLTPTPSGIVWMPGAGVSTLPEAPTRKYDKNRIEVLRLLLTSCCDPLYSPADEYNPLASRWLAVATAADAPNGVCLFYSLLNTILTYDPRSSGFSESNHVKLVELSTQVLAVLLDCGLPGNPEPVDDHSNSPVVEFHAASKGGFNLFRTLLARIDSGHELTMIFEGFTRLLRNVYESEATYIGGTKLECYQELLVLFWKFLEENPLFMTHILTRCNINDIIVPICFLMYKSRRDPAKIGLVHICTFVLLKLSGERSFGVALNKVFNKKLPTDLPLFHGCHADLLTITLHKLVVNGAYKLVPLYSCFLTIIANISPYWKSMSLVAAVKLVNLFELFSSPKFLYSGEYAHRHLALLLEVFNNIIQYQYHGNSHLVYAIVRRKDAFGHLASLTLKRAQDECHKVYGEKLSVQQDADSGPVNIQSMGIPDMNGATMEGSAFTPNQEWLNELKDNVPLETVTRLLQHLVPVVDEIVSKKNGTVDEQQILNVLNEITMVGLLPVPHPIVIRKYQPNQYTALWFTAFLWGVIFLKQQSLPLFDGMHIELFQVSVQEEDDE